jgi:hypothetical protein
LGQSRGRACNRQRDRDATERLSNRHPRTSVVRAALKTRYTHRLITRKIAGNCSFHNTISQWLFPKFFAGGDDDLWLREGGILPVTGYIVLSVMLYLWMRRRGESWQALWQRALDESR